MATTHEHPKVPGDDTKLTTAVLGTAAEAMQSFKPVSNICEHVCGFHFYSHDMTRQVEAHHYCSRLNEDVRQCLIYDSPEMDARLIGVEYIISAKLFKDLPDEEKKFWHSHVYEVKSGSLICPPAALVATAVARTAENKVMEDLIDTYGKTIHLWQVDRGDPLPYGPPMLMMAFTKDGQLRQDLVAARDKKFGVYTAELRKIREQIKPKNELQQNADHWVHRDDGMAYQTDMVLVAQRKTSGSQTPAGIMRS
jgi:hypothetical protein